MKTKNGFYLLCSYVMLSLIGLHIFTGTVVASEADTFDRSSWYKGIVDTEFVAQYAVVPSRDDVMIVDSRPARKYDSGHIVPAVNISYSSFQKQTDLLPADKSTLIIFYCGGVKCPLSHKSAFAAEQLGYTNVKVYADGYPVWLQHGNIPGISSAYLKKQIDKGAEMMVIDARPARKFDKGHVPTAVNISYTQFDTMIDQLPADKSTMLVYYCGGFKCALSSKSAAKAVALGYTNVVLYQPGWPEWKEAYGDSSSVSMLKTGEEEGMLTLESFNRLLREAPDSVYLIDVRDRSEVASDGTFKNARVLPVDEVEAAIAGLPADKPIVFFCSTGARSGEAYDMVKLVREELKAYFLDANVAFNKQEYPKVTPAD